MELHRRDCAQVWVFSRCLGESERNAVQAHSRTMAAGVTVATAAGPAMQQLTGHAGVFNFSRRAETQIRKGPALLRFHTQLDSESQRREK